MKTKIHSFTESLGSRWLFGLTLALFMAEAGWLAATSRFPMAFDEAYHFGLIRFFSHHPDPLITAQPAGTYRFGAIIQNPSFLYHYLLSFPYRLMTLFTRNPEIQVICLRLINVALAVASLVIMRRLLRLIGFSKPLANLLVLAVALTPLFTVLSAQISYDNLLILGTSASVYLCVSVLQDLRGGRADIRKLAILGCLCLFTSLVKFAFLPIFVAITGLVVWAVRSAWHKDPSGLKSGAARSYASINRYIKVLLLAFLLLGGFLFMHFYGVNLVRYHNPVPQCDQVLNVADCRHYYAWNDNYVARSYQAAHHAGHNMNALQYSAYWLVVNSFELFSVLVPLQGGIYSFLPYLVITGLFGVLMFLCMIANLSKIMKNRGLMALFVIAVSYLIILWTRNYHDYLRLGHPSAIAGRYLLPVLACIYALLASGLSYAVKDLRKLAPYTLKLVLAIALSLTFIYYGGARPYQHYIDPSYGHLSASDDFNLGDASP